LYKIILISCDDLIYKYDVDPLDNNAFIHLQLFTEMLLLFLFQEWPEEDYPPYANGPGYIVSSDIAHFVVSEFENHTLRVSLFSLVLLSLPLVLSIIGDWLEQYDYDYQ